MDHLGGGVSSEETDTTGPFVDGPHQIFHTGRDGVLQIPPIGPVLAEEAVKVTGPVEYRQILKSMFSSRRIRKMGISGVAATGTDPRRTTIGRQCVVIPVNDGSETARRNGYDSSVDILIETTVPFRAHRNSTLVGTDVTQPAFWSSGRFWW